MRTTDERVEHSHRLTRTWPWSRKWHRSPSSIPDARARRKGHGKGGSTPNHTGSGHPEPTDGICTVAPSGLRGDALEYLYVAPPATITAEDRKSASALLKEPANWRNNETSFLSGMLKGFEWCYFDVGGQRQIDAITGQTKPQIPWGEDGTPFVKLKGLGAMRIPVASPFQAALYQADTRTVAAFANMPELTFSPNLPWRNSEVSIGQVDAGTPDTYVAIWGPAAYPMQGRLMQEFSIKRVRIRTSHHVGYAGVSGYGEEIDYATLRAFLEGWGMRVNEVHDPITSLPHCQEY